MSHAASGAELARKIERQLRAFELPLSAEARARFIEKAAAFTALAVEWGARMDLTAARSEDELLDLLFADALAIGAISGASGGSWVDVGTGVGAPGIALALLDSSMSMTLVEPRAKRVAFLRTVVASLGLSTIRVSRTRSEQLSDKDWDVAVARATMPPEQWLPEGARLARDGVWVLLARAEPPVLAGYHVDGELQFSWPLTGRERRVLRYREHALNSTGPALV
jgi:16S rRNA (guanine527-N7)-methyltransferase